MLRFLALLLLASLAIAPTAIAQELPRETPKPPRDSKTRGVPYPPRGKAPVSGAVYIGDQAPDFQLDASSGEATKLSELRGDWIVLVFADRWRSVAPLRAAERELRSIDARLVTVCHEKQQALMRAAERDSVPFLMLADVTGEVSALYGLYDWKRSQTQPGFFILGQDGTVHIGVLGLVFPGDQLVYVAKLAMGAEE